MSKSKTKYSGESFTVRMPIHVDVGVRKKKKEFLNLNKYRNNVGHVNNTIKRKYKKEAEKVLPKDIFYDKFELEYTLYLPDKFRRDISNVLSIVDKDFCDALVELNIVSEDNYYKLQRVEYKLGGYDFDSDGYVDIKVIEVLENIDMEEDK